MEDKKEKKKMEGSFWTTLPGILTGSAAVIAAIGGLITALYAAGIMPPPTPTPEDSASINQIPDIPISPSDTIPAFTQMTPHSPTFTIQPPIETETQADIFPDTPTYTSSPTHTPTHTPSPTDTSTPTPQLGGFIEQPSFTGDCSSRPKGSTCLRFEDDYIWVVFDSVRGWGNSESHLGNPVRFAQGEKGEYHHVLNTNIVKGIASDPHRSGYIEQPSFTGDCSNRPLESICLSFEDGFIWLVYDSIVDQGEAGDFQGNRVRFSRGLRATYYHVLNTSLVKGVPE